MKVLLHIRAGQNFPVSFSVFEASLLVEVSTISKSFNRFLQRGSERRMKDTDHPIGHLGVHLADPASTRGRGACE